MLKSSDVVMKKFNVVDKEEEDNMDYERISGEEFDAKGKPILIGGAPVSKTFDDVTTFEETIDIALNMMRDVMIKKQKDYGPGNIDSEIGIAIRSNDKVARLRNLLNKNDEIVSKIKALYEEKQSYAEIGEEIEKLLLSGPENESIEDTWMDLANYGLIGLMFHKGAWGRPLAENQVDRFVQLDDSDIEEGNVY